MDDLDFLQPRHHRVVETPDILRLVAKDIVPNQQPLHSKERLLLILEEATHVGFLDRGPTVLLFHSFVHCVYLPRQVRSQGIDLLLQSEHLWVLRLVDVGELRHLGRCCEQRTLEAADYFVCHHLGEVSNEIRVLDRLLGGRKTGFGFTPPP